MSALEPVDPRVRLAIAQWPPDAPRVSVSTFCAEHGISRKTSYAIRQRALHEGQAAALEPRSRRPASSPNRVTDDVKQQAVGVRTALEASGLDHGPVSVHEKMRSLGMRPVPSTAKADPPRPRRQQRPVGWDGIRQTRVARNGIVQVRQTRFHVTRRMAGETVYLIETPDHLLIFDHQGTQIMHHHWPKPGVKYVSSGRPRGRVPKTL